MKFHENKLLTAVAAAALMLAVGACSSSSDDDEVAVIAPTVVEPVAPVAPVACEGTGACLAEAMTNLEAAQEALVALEASDDSTLGEVAAASVAVTGAETALTAAQTAHDEYIAMQPAPVPSVLALFVTAQASSDAAVAAGAAAEKAVKDATEASKLTTMEVNGDSMVATDNAQAILDAHDAAAKPVMDAQTALDNAMAAMVHAAALADDDASKSSLVAALEAAIMVAESHLKAATEHRDSETLETAVKMVTGDNPEAKGYPMTPADHGKAVAMAIGEALGGELDTDGIARGDDIVTATDGVPAVTVSNVVRMDDHTGKTWAEIVGDDALKDMRIAELMTGNSRAVKAASFADMPLAAIAADAPAEGDTIDDGNQYGGAYKGIDGVVYCAGADCKVEDAKLTGSWYFTPTSPMAYYEKVGVAVVYTLETDYAQFGHWLTVDAAGLATVNRYALSATATNPSWTVDADMMLTDTSATYEGTAAGMSLHKEVDGDGAAVPGTIQSGAFTADVTLTAQFSVEPADQLLGGTVDNFQGNAVDPLWTVRFDRTAVDTTGAVAAGRTDASGDRDGIWTADSYGAIDARPVGIFGGFNAHFLDGHAAGVYATRK